VPEPVVVRVHIDADPTTVYEYFTRPEAIVRWMGEYAHLEPVADGTFAVDIQGAPVRGFYVELDPPHRLVISWGYAGSETLPPGASTLEVRLVGERGGTSVELEHRDLPAAEVRGHALGWQHYLARLEFAAAGRDPGPDAGMPSASSG
jgi:uncharacterized protein YndB with AHSA1/START domain